MSTVHALWHGLAAVAVGAVAGVLVAYVTTSSPGSAPTRPVRPTVSATTIPAGSVPYELYTGCGVYEARIGNRYFEATGLPSGQSGFPPSWGTPYRPGTMTLVSPTEAVFTDSAGQRLIFKAHADARTFPRVCP